MPASAERDNAYFIKRIRQDHPKVYADYVAGIHESVTAARRAAGMISTPTSLHQLKRAWDKATTKERADFASWVGWTAAAPAARPLSGKALDHDGVLEPWAIDRIRKVLSVRRIEMGAAMKEMGFTAYDQSVSTALHGNTKVRAAVIVALARWLKANRRVA